jgi:hypothetical protein
MFAVLLFGMSSLGYGQLDKMVIPAGTPEDKDLTVISNEPDAQKKIAMYQDFLQKYASNPVAVAYANWQLSEAYQGAGDLQKATEFGDKAVAGAPHNLDVLQSQVTLAQQTKDNARVFKYAEQGGETYNSIEKQPKPADLSDADFAEAIASDKDANKSAYGFFEASAVNAIATQPDANIRMDYIEKFSTAFPNSKMQDQVGSLAMLSLSQLNDTQRLTAYAEKALAANPDNLPALLLLANAYADSPEPGKAVPYAQRAIAAAKADDPAADRSRKVSAGVAHSILGQVYTKQQKAPAAIAELKSATSLLKGQDEQQYARAAYYLGFNYAKIGRLTEARAVLTELASTPSSVQQLAKDLLAKVNAARSSGH